MTTRHGKYAVSATLLYGVAPIFMLALILALALASSARASYGEIGRFGEPGTKAGKLAFSEEHTFGLGVDPTENSVYVLDEPEAPEENAHEEHTRFLRLQKFSESGKLLASRSFTEKVPAGQWEEQGGAFVDGVAVDPGHDVYVLATQVRKASLPDDQESEVASVLYAFSTNELQPAGKVIENAKKQKETSDILSGPGAGELEAQSATTGKALLEPSGITVDPVTHEVIVLAHEDHSGQAADEIESNEDHYVLQRVLPTGALGERYVDAHNVLKTGPFHGTPDSPVVVPGSPEQVAIDYEGIVRIPYDFSSQADPTYLILEELPPNVVPIPLGVEGFHGGLQATGSPGGALSVSPEGTIYRVAGIRNELGKSPVSYDGVLARSAATGAELGWTGGQAPETSHEDKCVITPGLEEIPEVLAAGKEGKVFVLSPEFLDHEASDYEEPFFDAVIEFGTGGSGCPEASASAPSVAVEGQTLKAGQPVPAGAKATLSSQLTQADALSAEWSFGDGTPPVTVEGTEYGRTEVEHVFGETGMHTVKEVIHSDDLATPTIEQTLTLSVEHGQTRPTARFTVSPSAPAPGQKVAFNAINSSDPEKALPLTYEWNFGDGTKQTVVGSASVEHTYASAGSYSATLIVSDALHLVSEPFPVTVKVVASGGNPGGGTGGGSTGSSSSSGSSGSESATQTGGGAVQASQASQPPAVPDATLASSSLTVSANGAVAVKVTCQAQESSCAGTVTLRTLSAVVARGGAHAAKAKSKAKAVVLTLASGSFTVGGGQTRTVTLRLSAAARTLLGRSHVLRALATIAAHDPSGQSHTTRTTVTLRAAKPAHGKR
ncbi:MAG TPA: PKD domain-containing protein [Solirubrobacteraceae bacterium]|nr:PKD domain-containing protein [Solirubrobacteraceae bacterium]